MSDSQIPDPKIIHEREADRKPSGAISRRAQINLVIAFCVLLGLVVIFSDSTTKKPKAHATPTPAPADVATTDPRDVDALKAQLARARQDNADLEKVVREQNALLSQTSATRSTPADPASTLNISSTAASSPGTAGVHSSTASTPPPTHTTPANPLQEVAREAARDLAKRQYMGLYSSPLVVSYRGTGELSDKLLSPVSPASASVAPPPLNESAPSDSPSRVTILPTTPPADGPAAPQEDPASGGPAPRKSEIEPYSTSIGKRYRLFEGTVLETALLHRLNSDFSGPIITMTTADIYSHNRQTLLIPRGSKLIGDVKKVSQFGQSRVAVVFHRLIMPDGYSVSLDTFPGLNQVGETALQDKVNHHYFQIFGTSMALGLIAGAAQGTTTTGLVTSGSDAYKSGVAASMAQSSTRILDRFLNILPTLTIREGHRVKIFLTKDLLLPDYHNHTLPSDL